MGHFTNWLKRKGKLSEGELNPADNFKFNSGGDAPRDYEKDCQELTKTLTAKYFNEFGQFIKQLADERGDDELVDLLEKIQLEKKRQPDGNWSPRHPKDPDVISVPTADRGADQNGGGSQ